MPQVYEDLAQLQGSAEAAGSIRDVIDDLIYTSTFAENIDCRNEARRLIRDGAEALGCGPASIAAVYKAMGDGSLTGFTVPAINIRTMTYDVARAILRVAKRLECGPILFEIARSEIGYTMQRPGEYAASILAAAIKEQWEHPVFIQGDHFQVNAAKYKADPAAEVNAVKALIDEAIPAGFYNIDLDTSTLVDLSHDSIDEQQRLNYEVGVELNKYVRDNEPSGVSIALGGEIGEVGKQNSTPEELQAYMNGYNAALPDGMKGISKISVQTGTSHGGVPLPDGSIAEVAVDFETLATLSKVSRERYGLGGAVQHGASTLPDELFDRFPQCDTCEIHLATGFQNIIYDHTPADLKQKVYDWLAENCGDERKPEQTDEQFYYKTRKKGFGPFKWEFWNLPDSITGPMFAELEAKFELLFTKLNNPGRVSVLNDYYGSPNG